MANKTKFSEAVKKILSVDQFSALKKVLFEGEEEIKEEVKEEMAEATLIDGTAIIYDKLEEGGKVEVITDAGPTPAPDGMHELTDGTIIDVVGGLITAVGRKEVEVEMAEGQAEGEVKHPKQETAIDLATFEKMVDDKCEALYKRVMEAMTPKEKMEEVTEEVKEDIEEMKAAFKAIVPLIEHLMEEEPQKTNSEPAAQQFSHVQHKKNVFAKSQEAMLAAKQWANSEKPYKTK